MTKLIYKFKGVSDQLTAAPKENFKYDRSMLAEILLNFKNLSYRLLEQNKNLPFFNSREDLLINKRV